MNRSFKDLTGIRFGELTALCRVGSNAHLKATWLCRCDCGSEKVVVGTSLTNGLTLSCGCTRNKKLSEANKTHGLTGTRLYSIWKNMKKRCYSSKNNDYRYYGGKGIRICEDWKNDFASFHNWAMENGYSDVLTIDRKDNEKGYSPDNCRWVTRAEQNRNIDYSKRKRRNA